MFDHVGLHVRDVHTSRRFYRAVLEPLRFVEDGSGTGFGPKDAPTLWLYESVAARDSRVHLAFAAKSRSAVDGFHAAGIASGGRDNGPPALRADYGPNYYAAFLLDPDGNNVEAVCMNAE